MSGRSRTLRCETSRMRPAGSRLVELGATVQTSACRLATVLRVNAIPHLFKNPDGSTGKLVVMPFCRRKKGLSSHRIRRGVAERGHA